MSEPKKMSEILQEEVKSQRELISALELKMKILEGKSSTTSTPEQHEEKKSHGTLKEIEACPTCSEKFKLKAYLETKKALALKEVKEKLKSKELVTCDGCGEIVEKTVEECPSCHGRKAH